jgi:DNA-binding transcriptional LysR family regulator
MDLSHKQLEYILTLDRYRHFGRAAEALGISQPALSRSILAAEKRLEATLFDRSRNGIEATEVGVMVLRHARNVAQLAAELDTHLAELEGRERRALSVVCGHYPAELTVPRALSALMKNWPDIHINMEVADWSRGIQLLEQAVCELAVIELSAKSETLELHHELLNDRQVFPVVREGHPLARSDHPSLDEVLSWPWASSRIPQRAAQQLSPGPLAAGDFDDSTGYFVPKILSSSLSTSLRLVMESDIVGIAPLTAAEPWLADGRLRLVRLNLPWMRLNYGFVREKGKAISTAVDAFMEQIRTAEAQEKARDEELRARYAVDAW